MSGALPPASPSAPPGSPRPPPSSVDHRHVGLVEHGRTVRCADRHSARRRTRHPATMTHGPNETLLTGTELSQATAAATAAVPGATVIRAETDSSGGYPYEVHMEKSDGTYVTVELDSTSR